MTLDVAIPTYKRRDLLRLTLQSLTRARVPDGLTVNIYVIDNNSPDDTEAVVREFAASSPLPVHYVLETKQGSSHTRNAGVLAGGGELIGFVDDDEEVEEQWFEVVAREFADPAVQFIGGPYLPNWVSPVPAWLPPGYHAAIGAIPPKPRSPFGPAFSANLMGGNAVLRRAVYGRVGLYNPKLGRTDKRLLSEEDAEFLRRLLVGREHGLYVPDLAIRHFVDPRRLTRNYHRRWCFWRGVSQGLWAREQREALPYLFGVPRYLYGRAAKGLLSMPERLLSRRNSGELFARELAVWDLLGQLWGRHFFRMDAAASGPGGSPPAVTGAQQAQ